MLQFTQTSEYSNRDGLIKYSVNFPITYTFKDVIEDIIKRNKNGQIYLDNRVSIPIFDCYLNIIEDIPIDLKDKEVESIEVIKGYNSVDYIIKIK